MSDGKKLWLRKYSINDFVFLNHHFFFHRNYFQITSSQLKVAVSQHKSEKAKIKEVSQIEPVMAFIAILIMYCIVKFIEYLAIFNSKIVLILAKS